MWPPPQPKPAAAEQTHSIARLSTCPRGLYRRDTASIPAEENKARGNCARWCACAARLCPARLSITVMAVVTDLHRVSFPPNGGLACRRPVETSLSQDKEVSESRLFQLCLHYSKAGKKCQGAASASDTAIGGRMRVRGCCKCIFCICNGRISSKIKRKVNMAKGCSCNNPISSSLPKCKSFFDCLLGRDTSTVPAFSFTDSAQRLSLPVPLPSVRRGVLPAWRGSAHIWLHRW